MLPSTCWLCIVSLAMTSRCRVALAVAVRRCGASLFLCLLFFFERGRELERDREETRIHGCKEGGENQAPNLAPLHCPREMIQPAVGRRDRSYPF